MSGEHGADAPDPPDASSPESADPEARLEQRLGYRFVDRALLREALTHRSYVNECSDRSVKDNERLEFLGDAVIDLIVSVELMERHPLAHEGPLSKMRAALVSEPGLAKLAERLGLGDSLRLGRGEEMSGGRDKPSILADAFEALIAAVYKDAGMARVRELLVPMLQLSADTDLEAADAKTVLQQKVQAERHLTPYYRLVQESGPDHQKSFVVELIVDAEVLGSGEGRTKKEAEQRAAASVLAKMDAERTGIR